MLAEDEGFGDITSNAVVDEDKEVNAYIVSKDKGILAGINIIKDLILEQLLSLFIFLYAYISPIITANIKINILILAKLVPIIPVYV